MIIVCDSFNDGFAICRVSLGLLVRRVHQVNVDSEYVSFLQPYFLPVRQYHAILSNTMKIENTVDSSQDIVTKIPLEHYRNANKLSTDVLAGR